MAITTLQASLSAGELSPAMYGRVDLAEWHAGCSVARNFFVSYRGGLMSRAGTALVGVCKQAASASSVPPRNIEFNFSLFQSYVLEFGDHYMRVIANGGYVTEAPFAISGITNATQGAITAAGNSFNVGDWVFVAAVQGMTPVNGLTFIVAAVLGGGAFLLNDVFGDPFSTAALPVYTGGGTVARIYTLTTPYAAADLPYLKYTQSADVMSLTCVNQQTLTDYPPQDLTRVAANNWTIAPPAFGSSINAPGSCTATASNVWVSGAGPAAYAYVVTAVDAVTGQESIASPIGSVTNSVAISAQFGTITVTWGAVTGAGSYNVYRAPPDYTNSGSFTGQLYGYVGSSRTTRWQDTNVIADFSITPPLHTNPFNATGKYPGVVAYFQQRRAYAYTINAPDTYQMSQPGAYTNFDAADPPIDSNAIVGKPWASQVNGIQWMLPMPGGLIVGTGKDVWQVAGTAGAASPITPSQQSAQPQEAVGFAATVPPIKIDRDIVFVQALGSIVRDLQYSFYQNIYTGVDVTVLSNHMFEGRQILQWAWAREPYKVLWAVRDDGRMLALTYAKDRNVTGWTRHDTNGIAVSVATASEPPVNAAYWIVKRYILGKGRWAYFQERADNRLWQNVEQAWCVDCGLSLAQPKPNATLSASRATPTGACLIGQIIQGGQNYSANVAGVISDPTGSGAVVAAITVVNGAITGVTVFPTGSGYTAPQIKFTDATGSGAVVELFADTVVRFTSDVDVFQASDVGKVIRLGGGVATIAALNSASSVDALMSTAITATVPNDPNNLPLPAPPGTWTLTAPVQVVSGLNHLEGMVVAILADGVVVPNQVVVNGLVTLPKPASQITIGLPFTPQAQSMHADLPGTMIQGKRKRITGVTVRVANTRGIKVGQDQPIAAATPNQAETPWNQAPNLMTEIIDTRNDINIGAAEPLFTGDRYFPLAGDWNTADGQASPGMIAVMQDYPLPAEILAFVPKIEVGDIPDA